MDHAMSNKTPGQYAVEWARIQQARRRFTISVWAFVPGAMIIGMVVPRHSSIRLFFLVPLFVGVVASVIYLRKFRCTLWWTHHDERTPRACGQVARRQVFPLRDADWSV
jgi:hypothetical protein